MSTRTVRASVEALEDRLSPALLSLLPSVSEGVGVSARVSALSSAPLLAIEANLAPALGLRALLGLALPVLNSHVGASVGVSLNPGLHLGVKIAPGKPDVPTPTPGDVPTPDVPTPTPGDVPTPGDGTTTEPSAGPVQQPTQPIASPPSTGTPPSIAPAAGGQTPPMIADAPLVAETIIVTLSGRAQPAFLTAFALVPTSPASIVPQDTPPPALDAPAFEPAPSGGKLPHADAAFAEGGADEPELPDDEPAPPAPQLPEAPRKNAPEPDVEFGLAGASPEGGFAQDFRSDEDDEGGGGLMLAGLGGGDGLPNWLVFSLAVGTIAATQLVSLPRRRRALDACLMVDEIPG